MSVLASFLSAIAILGFSAEIYRFGTMVTFSRYPYNSVHCLSGIFKNIWLMIVNLILSKSHSYNSEISISFKR